VSAHARDIGEWLASKFIEAGDAYVVAVNSDEPHAIDAFRAYLDELASTVTSWTGMPECLRDEMDEVVRSLVERARCAASDRKTRATA
jgi:hypothetical protein